MNYCIQNSLGLHALESEVVYRKAKETDNFIVFRRPSASGLGGYWCGPACHPSCGEEGEEGPAVVT